MEAPVLVVHDIIEAIGHSAAKLEINRPLAEPAPALKGAWRNVPTAGQFYLVQMPYRHRALLRMTSKICEQSGRCAGRNEEGPGRALGRNGIVSGVRTMSL
jgi:hypothetical protein